MSDTIKINKLISKYGLFLIIGSLLSSLLGFIKFKYGDTIFQNYEKPDVIYAYISYSMILFINIICAVLIWIDLKRQQRMSGLIIALTLLNFLVGIVVFLLKTINNKNQPAPNTRS
jgi:hypothetical protein